jgi:predicted rRNA methylase YqxC with S4 and FtsJ domains
MGSYTATNYIAIRCVNILENQKKFMESEALLLELNKSLLKQSDQGLIKVSKEGIISDMNGYKITLETQQLSEGMELRVINWGEDGIKQTKERIEFLYVFDKDFLIVIKR